MKKHLEVLKRHENLYVQRKGLRRNENTNEKMKILMKK